MPWALVLMLLLSLVLSASLHLSGVIFVMVKSPIPANVMSRCVNLADAAHDMVSLVVIVSFVILLTIQRMTLLILTWSQSSVLVPVISLVRLSILSLATDLF